MVIRIALLTVLWDMRYAAHYANEATERYFAVVLFIMLFKVVLSFASVHKILKCGHSNESY